MPIKDYYRILEIGPSASLQEVKKAYRKLAQQYHPDKTNNDPYAAARFAEIKEASEVLTNPAKKEYYLQQRWYDQSMGKRKTREPVTPVTVLRQALELEKYISTLDAFRMDKDGLKQYILELLADPTIEQLKKFTEPEISRQITRTILLAMHPLPGPDVKDIAVQLYKLTSGDDSAGQWLSAFIQKKERINRREKYSFILIIAASILLCLLIYLAGR